MSIIGKGSSILSGATLYDGVPVALTGNTNNLTVNPDTFSLLLLLPLVALSLTGIKHSQSNRVIVVANIGKVNITLKNASGSSDPDAQMNLGGADIVLAPNAVVVLLSLTRAAGWVLISTSTSPTAPGGTGTVTAVSAVVPDDFTVNVATPTTTPAITITHGVVLPTVLAAGATNNLNPGGPFPVSIDRVDFDTTAGDANVTGLVAGQDGQRIIARNIGANNLTLNNEDAGSAAANRFSGASDLILTAGGAATLVYYAGSVAKWVLVP
jgi:hypothetical protein